MNTKPDMDSAELYVNRELSLLAFFKRVLAMASWDETPLLERLRFLTICSTIIDEFFEIRVAGLKQRAELGLVQLRPDGLTPLDTLGRISVKVRALVDEQYRVLNKQVLPALAKSNIRILRRTDWSAAQKKWCRRYFETQVAPVLTPIGLDPSHPFPRVINKSLNMIVALEGVDAFGRASDYAVLHVPRCLPRVIKLPAKVAGGPDDFVLLSSVIHAHVDQAFPGMKIRGCHQFRLTRNADLLVAEEEVDDLLDALSGQLHHRRYGDAVRLEVVAECPKPRVAFLIEHFALHDDDLFRVKGPVNLHRLGSLYNQVDRPDLKFRQFTAGQHSVGDLFEQLNHRDILLHHPYESFTPVVDLIRQAANDPDVLAIKQTLYRTGSRSPMVKALADAARSGKEVTAVIELRARFDEEHNIQLATLLQEAGAHVVYGVVGFKTHAKMLMIVRREGSRLRRYVHLGTGNYHTGTARAYTDFSLMTANDAIGEDVHALFIQLTGTGQATELTWLLQSPFTLSSSLIQLIDAEIAEARAGRAARVIAKINSLSDPTIIRALYRASQAGVQVDLIIRGICCLRPGIPGVSDNIRVVSVVGRFLEHTRIYHFHAAGKRSTWLASADWMIRNLSRRVEISFPILDPTCRDRVIEEGLMPYLQDTSGTWVMQPDGDYIRVRPEADQPEYNAQLHLLDLLAESFNSTST